MLRATPRLAPDQAGPFQRDHHLVHRWRADAEMALQVGFGRRTTVHARVGVDEGQVLTLPLREAWSRRRLTDGWSMATSSGEVVMSIRYRVELSEVERAGFASCSAAASTPPAGSSGASSCWRPTPGSRTRPSPAASTSASRPSPA